MRNLAVALTFVMALTWVPLPGTDTETIGQFTPCNPRVQQCG